MYNLTLFSFQMSIPVKVFKPNEAEFKNMAKMLAEIENNDDCIKAGMVKVSIELLKTHFLCES